MNVDYASLPLYPPGRRGRCCQKERLGDCYSRRILYCPLRTVIGKDKERKMERKYQKDRSVERESEKLSQARRWLPFFVFFCFSSSPSLFCVAKVIAGTRVNSACASTRSCRSGRNRSETNKV